MVIVCRWVCILGRDLEVTGEGFESGSVNSSLLAGGEDNKWLDFASC
jgi:hypothetical protein